MEAVVNSIHATQNMPSARVQIIIERETLEGEGVHRNTQAPIKNFAVVDTGIGFTEENFVSFETLDSQAKEKAGGKGVGRLTWLKAFKKAEVYSVYTDQSAIMQRSFRFELSDDGISNHKHVTAASGASTHTCVRLVGFNDVYRASAPKTADAIARRIMEHCLQFFILDSAPLITVEDEGGDPIDLRDLFQETYKPNSNRREFHIHGHRLWITDVLMSPSTAAQTAHEIHYCAHHRVVVSHRMSTSIPHLTAPLEIPERGPCIYQAYITGDLLDARVDAQRTSFSFDPEGELALLGPPTWEELEETSLRLAKEFVDPYREAAVSRHMDRVQTYVHEHPEYRALLKHRQSDIEGLSSGLSDDALDDALLKIKHEWQRALRRDATSKLAAINTDAGLAEFRAEFQKTLGELNESATSDLA